jgi:sugar phosphate isomerase/epimerase
MYKNLNPAALGITGRQSELIELALTYGFRGLDLNMAEVIKRARSHGLDSARRYVASASVRVGEFALTTNWEAPDIPYHSSLVELQEIAQTATALGATVCTAMIKPYSDERAYHENFELHRRRLAEMGELLAKHNIQLGLAFYATAAERQGHQVPFIHQAETLLTLIKTSGSPHVGLTLDTWTWFVGGGTLELLRQIPPQQIVAARFADYPADADLAQITAADRHLPGDGGGVNCAAILRYLAEHEFAGPATLCPHPSRFRGMTRDAIVQQASAKFDALFRAAGISRSGKLEPMPEAQ